MDDKKALDDILELASSLIRNRCVNDGSGNAGEERNTQQLTAFFAQRGFEAQTVQDPTQRSSLYLMVEEKRDLPTYGLMGHVDVVTANPKDWSFDPFGGEVRDGFLCGRGAVDMLGQLAAMAVATGDHLKSGKGKNVRFYAMADEEADGAHGAAWFTKSYSEVARCDALFSELGGFYLSTEGKGAVSFVCAEKGVARVRLTARGRCGHGSLPYGSDNALLKAAEALGVLERELSYPVLGAGYREFVNGLPLEETQKIRLTSTETVDNAIDEVAKNDFGLARYLHGASRLTVMPGVMRAGSKVNVVPDYAVVDLDLRLPQQMSLQELEENLNRLSCVLDELVQWEITEFTQGNSSPMEHNAVKEALMAAKKINPTLKPVPFISGGVSDSRFWRAIGVPSYGFALFAKDITIDSYSKLLHGIDEKISLESLLSMYRFYRELLK